MKPIEEKEKDICHKCGADWTSFNEDDSMEFEPPCFCDLEPDNDESEDKR